MFTATGRVKGGTFVAAAPNKSGPYVMLQGLFDAKTNELRQARIVQGIESFSGSVRSSHLGSGITVYAPLNA
jgi:hypothetical protein